MGVLIIRPMWGLANRLLGLTSGLRLAERYGAVPIIAWEPSEQAMAEFTDLFEGGVALVRLRDCPADALHLDTTGTIENTTRVGNVLNPRIFQQDKILIHTHSILASAEDTFQSNHLFFNSFALDLHRHFRRLGLSRPVSSILESLGNSDFTNVIGVHIRRPPPVTNPSEEVFNIPSDEYYLHALRVMLYHNPDLRFYISTNGQRTEDFFKQHLGNRMIVYAKRSIDHQREAAAVQDALIDMILLSKCRAILRYEPSTFAYFASLIGHKPQMIISKASESGNPSIQLVLINQGKMPSYQLGSAQDMTALLACS